MSGTFSILLASAATLGFVHTAIGLDHSLPFVVLARSRGWALGRTLGLTLLCGSAHVLSSVLIATVGFSLGLVGSQLSIIEEARGNLAAWLLVGFGLAYAGVAYFKGRARHYHWGDRRGDHGAPGSGSAGPGRLARAPSEPADLVAMPAARVMPALLVVFALGPCEALIPLLMASGVSLSVVQSCLVAFVFSLSTVLTMLALVALGCLGASKLRIGSWSFGHHAHALSGLTLALSGVVIQAFGT